MKALFFALAIFSLRASAAEVFITCPAKVESSETLKSVLPKGYSVGSEPLPHFLNRVRVFDGNPKDLAELAPDSGDSNPGKAGWSFDEPREMWMTCGYTETGISLMRELPKGLASCKHDYDSKSDTLKGLKCKKH